MHQQIKVFILIIVIKKIVNRIRTWCGSIQSFLFNLPDKLKTFLLYTNKKYGTLHEFACHPCAGAMLIFSVSFQF